MAFPRKALACLLMPALIALGAAGPSYGQTPLTDGTTVIGSYGDWSVQCDGAPESEAPRCALTQSVVATDRDNVGVIVIILWNTDRSAFFMRVVGPLGVLLEEGLEVTVDGEHLADAAFVRCVQEGCVAEIDLEQEALTALIGGTSLAVSVSIIDGERISLPMSLRGFGKGLSALP